MDLTQFLKIVYYMLDTFLNIKMYIHTQGKAEHGPLLKNI